VWRLYETPSSDAKGTKTAPVVRQREMDGSMNVPYHSICGSQWHDDVNTLP
jgi:hypothetical protein